MKTILLADIKVGDRQRKEFAPKQLSELADSILKNGLLHPIVLTDDFTLVAGERRLRAISDIHQTGLPFTHDGGEVPIDHIPYTLLKDVDEATLAEAEFAENLFRVDLSWQERTQALNRLYELRKQTTPSVSMAEIGKEVAISGEVKADTARKQIAQAKIVAPHLNDPEVKRARSAEEAYKIVLDRAEKKAKASAIQAALPTATLHQIIHGDAFVELKKLPSNSVHTIITDPPYGMNADKMGKGEFHMYDDSPEAALAICQTILAEGFRVAKPKAVLFMFCDLDHFLSLRTFAAQQAWTCWRKPLIWRKGTDGHSPWGRAGFVYTYEAILFAVKGEKELVYPGGPDILDFKRPGRGERVHSAEKPISLLRHLIKLSTQPGQVVLDPTAGSGAIIEAATLEKVKAIAIEKEESYYHECVQRLSKPSSIVEPDGEIPFTKTGGVGPSNFDLLAD